MVTSLKVVDGVFFDARGSISFFADGRKTKVAPRQ